MNATVYDDGTNEITRVSEDGRWDCAYLLHASGDGYTVATIGESREAAVATLRAIADTLESP